MDHVKRAVLCGAIAALAAGCGGLPGARSGAHAPAFAADHRWDDGQAEVSLYSGTTAQYGADRPTAAEVILMKEDVLEASLVKSDSGAIPGRTCEAMKMNFIVDYPTGTYAYHQMVSVFLRRSDLRPLKETMSSTEGRGMVFVSVGPRRGRLTHTAHSYREGEGDREVAIAVPKGELWWTDALPVTLRALAGESAPFERRVGLLPSQVGSSSPLEATVPVPATVRMVGTVPLSVPDGAYVARHFTVTTARGTDLYWFDAEAPHVMLKMETTTGRRLELQNTVRIAYWEHTAPGDERLLRE